MLKKTNINPLKYFVFNINGYFLLFYNNPIVQKSFEKRLSYIAVKDSSLFTSREKKHPELPVGLNGSRYVAAPADSLHHGDRGSERRPRKCDFQPARSFYRWPHTQSRPRGWAQPGWGAEPQPRESRGRHAGFQWRRRWRDGQIGDREEMGLSSAGAVWTGPEILQRYFKVDTL